MINKKVTETSQNSPCTKRYSYYIGQYAKKIRNDLFYHSYNLSSFIIIGYNQWICILAEKKVLNKSISNIIEMSMHTICFYEEIKAQWNLIFLMIYHLPTNWFFFLSLTTKWKYVCYVYISSVSIIVFCLFYLPIHCHYIALKNVRCIVNFVRME